MTPLPPRPMSPRTAQRGTLVVVIVAQFLMVAGTACLLVMGAVLFVLANLAPESLPALIYEQLPEVFVVALLLFPVHLAIVIGLRVRRRWAIILHALASIGYSACAVVALANGPGRSTDAQHATIVLVCVLLITLAVLNALAVANWRQMR